MTSSLNRNDSALGASWASVDLTDAQSVDLSTDDESSLIPPPTMSSSKISRTSHASGRSSQISSRGPATDPDITPRPRRTQTAQQSHSAFVMPSLVHADSGDAAGPDSPMRPPKRPRGRPPKAKKDNPSVDNVLGILWAQILQPAIAYAFSILGLAFGLAKPVIGYVLAILLLVAGFNFLSGLLYSRMNAAMAPICLIPGTGYLNLPFCPPVNHSIPAVRDIEFDKLMHAQSAFEDVLTASSEYASLPMDMKRSESSIRDLRQVVQYSALPSKNELVFEFNGFVETAREASNDLSRYNSRIGRAIDGLLTTNKWTYNVLSTISPPSHGLIPTIINSINPIALFRPPPASEMELVYQQYQKHTAAIEEQLQLLITQAQSLLAILTNLDDRLDLINSIAKRDGLKVSNDRDEVLAALWTKLGGNRASVTRTERQLRVLNEVGAYRRLAVAHVSATVVKLQNVMAGLEDLRERVGTSETLNVPLELHLEQVRLGVERLEATRDEGRAAEGRRHRTILDKEERVALIG